MCGPKFCSMKITQDVRDYSAKLNDPSSLGEAGGGGARSATEGAAGQRPADVATRADVEKGMADMSAKFAAVGKELYVSESGEKREGID